MDYSLNVCKIGSSLHALFTERVLNSQLIDVLFIERVLNS